MSRRVRTPRRAGVRHAVHPRDAQAWWDWTYCVARQLARLPAGRLVVRVEAYDVSVLLDQGKGDGA